MSADNLKVSTDSVNRLDVADVHKGNSPESESKNPSESLNSPLTSVKHLLADTDAAPPLQSEPQSQRPDASYEDSQKASEPQIRRKGKGKSKSGEKLNAAGSTHESPTFQQTLQDLRTLLMPFLKLLPFQSLQVYLKRFIAPLVRFIVRVVAKILHKWNFGLATNLAYDLHLLLWKWVINLFFREIRPRGAYRVPRTGPVLFVCGPHQNQFLDPLLLMSEVRLSANRRVSFLIAEKSYHLSFIGLASKIAHSIPVARAADLAVSGKGKIFLTTLSSSDNIIKGRATSFTTQLSPKCQIRLGKAYGYATVEVLEVIDDHTVKIKKMFGKENAVQGLVAAGAQDGDEAGLEYSCLPYIDQTKMYSSVYTKLSEGGCIGIFPEGTSHDRTDFLPLKHGLAIMALGAMAANPNLKVQIVPVGLNYFHPDRFRSRAVIEFGNPIDIPPELVSTFTEGGQGKRDAIGSIMELVFDGLKSVTVRAPDYETLMVIQASRRLYKPPGQQLNLSQVVDLNKKFIMGYNTYREEPRVQDLYKKVEAYNKSLRQLGLKDHQVDGANRPLWKSLVLLLWRTGLISAWTLAALPGIIMNAPIFVVASIISARKAREAKAASTVKLQGRDVLASWKVLVSLGMAPILYGFYTAVVMYCVFRYHLGRNYLFLTPFFMLVAVPSFGYSALRFGEVGMDIYKSLPPLFMSLFPSHHKQIERLRLQRQEVTEELTSLIQEFAPKLWADFESGRIIPNSAFPQNYSSPSSDSHLSRSQGSGSMIRRKSSYGPESSILQHPMTWIDEKLFGWSSTTRSKRRRYQNHSSSNKSESSNGDLDSAEYTPSPSEPVTPGYRSDSADDEPADYDDVVRAVEEKLKDMKGRQGDGVGSGDNTETNKRLRRRSSSARSRSQLNLMELAPLDGMSTAVQGSANAQSRHRRSQSHTAADTAKDLEE